MFNVNRRQALALGGAGILSELLFPATGALAQASDKLTIAFNVNLPSFDPTVGPSAVNPSIQAIYRAIFDQPVGQKPDLSFTPGLLTAWGWNDDKSKVWMDAREGVVWHDGSPFTPEDVVWSLERAGDPKTGNPIQFVWGTIGNFKIDGHRVTADVKQFDPVLFKWMAFLTGYILPKAYFAKVGAEGFEKKPVGAGPYMMDEYQGNSFLRLKRNDKYWGPKGAFETVIFKFVPDPTSRVAEIESGSADVTLEVPFEEFDRLKSKPGLAGVCEPISDIGMIFISNNNKEMEDENVRLGAIHAIDKDVIAKRLLHGYATPIATLQAPSYIAFNPEVKDHYDPELSKKLLAKSGYSPEKPVKFTIQTTRGFKPKDYEMVQAIVGMWRKVGIAADIEVYEIAKHYELRAGHKLAPMAFYNWGNAIGDPTTSTGFAMYSKSPHSAWKSQDVDDLINPLWAEKDEEKRIAGWKKVDEYVHEKGYVIPLVQYFQPIVFKSSLKVTPNGTGALQPTLVSKA
jgi:peptide/nickel transport system substrate-binding protein